MGAGGCCTLPVVGEQLVLVEPRDPPDGEWWVECVQANWKATMAKSDLWYSCVKSRCTDHWWTWWVENGWISEVADRQQTWGGDRSIDLNNPEYHRYKELHEWYLGWHNRCRECRGTLTFRDWMLVQGWDGNSDRFAFSAAACHGACPPVPCEDRAYEFHFPGRYWAFGVGYHYIHYFWAPFNRLPGSGERPPEPPDPTRAQAEARERRMREAAEWGERELERLRWEYGVE